MSTLVDVEPTSITNAARVAFLETEQVLIAQPVRLPVHLRQIKPRISIDIAFPEFDGVFGGPVTVDSSEVDSGRVIAIARITPNLDLLMKFVGESAGEADPFSLATVEIRHRDLEQRSARDVFVTYTLFALLGLSRSVDLKLRIPEIERLVSLSFDVSLSDISQYLRSRQIAYKVMVIERATREQFLFPPTRSAAEVATISFIFEAITKRTFLWPDNYDGGLIRLPAAREGLDDLLALGKGGDLKFGPQRLTRALFGKTVSLGLGTITVLDAVIDDIENLKATIERGDGSEVQVRIRSRTGRIRYDLPEAPRIDQELWESGTQTLIDIEPHLDAALFERYNALAAGSLAGLTDDEKARVTARVDFGAAFLPNEIHGDNTLWQRLLRFLRFP